MTHTLRVLTRDVPNPKHDKRKRRRLEGFASFPAGTRFVLRPSTGEDPATLDLIDHDFCWGWINRDLEVAFLEASETAPTLDWKGIAAAVHGRTVGDWWAVDVLNRLLRDGAIIPQQVAEALRAEMESPVPAEAPQTTPTQGDVP